MMLLFPIASSPLYFIFVLFHVELEQLCLCGYVYKFKDECKLAIAKRSLTIEALRCNNEFEYFVMNHLKCITKKCIKMKR